MSQKVCENCKAKNCYPENKPSTTGNPSGDGRSNNTCDCKCCNK